MPKSQPEPGFGTPLERFHFFFFFFLCRCNIGIHYRGGSNKSHKYKGRGERRRVAGGHCDLTRMCPRAFRATFAVGQQRRAVGGSVGVALNLAFTFVSQRAKRIGSLSTKTQMHCLRDKAGPKLIGRGQKNASSASNHHPPAPPPDPSPLHRRVSVSVCWRLRSESARVCGLPSAMRCSGTCRITRTERLQAR